MKDIVNMVGHNFRLGEIECAIGIEQLKKLPAIAAERQRLANLLTDKLKDLTGLILPEVPAGCTHVYYVFPMQIDENIIGVGREQISDALIAEGVNVMRQYQNIHRYRCIRKKIAFGSNSFPWTSEFCKRDVSYVKGICPIAEKLQDDSFFGIGMCVYDLNEGHIGLISEAFHKVWSHLAIEEKWILSQTSVF